MDWISVAEERFPLYGLDRRRGMVVGGILFLFFPDGTDGMPVSTVESFPAYTVGIVDAPRAVRVVRIERRRPVEAVGTGIPEIRVDPVTGGGKEDAVAVRGGYDVSSYSSPVVV